MAKGQQTSDKAADMNVINTSLYPSWWWYST